MYDKLFYMSTGERGFYRLPARGTLVMCDQLDTVDLRRLTDSVGFLTIAEMQRVDEALALILDL